MAKNSSIRSRKHASAVSPLLSSSLFALSALALPLSAMAQEAAKQDALPEVKVKAKREAPYKAEQSASSKLTQPLLDTPKTVQVVKQAMLKEQGAATLMDALRNTPGITMQLGENGNTSAGDAFQMRGFSTQNSTFVDGIRDMGAVTRDVFNIEQVEIVKGPAGADIGRGAASGYINLISKLPIADTVSDVSLTLGSSDKKRITADLNSQLSETSAFRVNVMAQDSGVDGRDVVKQKGKSFAPSLAFGLGTPTRIYLYSQHVRADNTPDGGIPAIGLAGYRVNAGGTGDNVVTQPQADALTGAPRVNRSNFYGSKNDREIVSSDMFTAKFELDVGAGTTVRNISRYGKTHMDRVLTGVSALVGSNVVTADPSTWTVTRNRQRLDQTNEILVNQTSVNAEIQQGAMKHSLAAGVEFMYERQLTLGFGNSTQTINGVSYSSVNSTANLYNPNSDVSLAVPYRTGADTDGKTLTLALYALDTLTINDAWKVNGGLRMERYSASTNGASIVTGGANGNIGNFPGYTAGDLAPVNLSDSDSLLSWNIGAVYKPTVDGSIYAAFANSLTPPGGTNFTLSNAAGSQANGTMDPQETRSIELGTKWDLLNKQLNVTAAVFNTENDKQVTADPVLVGVVHQSGKTRVRGLELAATGNITNFWQVWGGLSKMKTEQLDQYSRSNNGTGTLSQNNLVRFTPDFSAAIWTSYQFGDYTVGAGLNHMGKLKRVTGGAALATDSMPIIPKYTIASLMGAYKVNKNVNLQLNVTNLFDKDYISAPNNSGARLVLGTPRSASLTASVKF